MYNNKSYTILVYANGNNDLAPEMEVSKLCLERVGSNENVNVVLQLGIIDSELVKIFRPNILKEFEIGTNRYYINNGSSTLLESLEAINMSDPKNLYDFIKWGMENFPSEHYVLILGGHVFQFIGLLPDYSQDKPYILGFPEMCLVLDLIKINLNKKIDLLILDVCYCNCIELLYELGKSANPSVDYLMTYNGKGPLSGLPYDLLIRTVQNNFSKEMPLIIKEIIDKINLNLISFQINHSILDNIKNLFNQIALDYLCENTGNTTPGTPLSDIRTNSKYKNTFSNIKKSTNEIILHTKIPTNISSGVFILQNTVSDLFLPLYARLAFAKDNNWCNLLINSSIERASSLDITLQPLELSMLYVSKYFLLINPTLDEKQIAEKINELNLYFNREKALTPPYVPLGIGYTLNNNKVD